MAGIENKLKTMSGHTYEPYQAAHLLAHMMLSDKPHQINRGTGMQNAQKQHEYTKYLQDYEKALGEERSGYIPLDKNGRAIKNATYYEPLVGKMVHTDSEGRVMFQNGQIVKQVESAIDEREERINVVVKQCIKNDNLCCLKLQITQQELVNRLGACKMENGTVVNCTPNAIRLYTPKTEKKNFAIHQLRLLVDERLIYCNEIGGTEHAGDINNPRVTEASEDITDKVLNSVNEQVDSEGKYNRADFVKQAVAKAQEPVEKPKKG